MINPAFICQNSRKYHYFELNYSFGLQAYIYRRRPFGKIYVKKISFGSDSFHEKDSLYSKTKINYNGTLKINFAVKFIGYI